MWRRRAWLRALPALAAAPRAYAGAAVSSRRPLQFPRDHGAHPQTAIEWWYVTGWLARDAEPQYGFQITFFRSHTGFGADSVGRFAARQLLFAHAALSDLRARRHVHAQRFARWSGEPGTPLAGAATADTDVHIGEWLLRRSDGGGRSRYAARFGGGAAAQAFELAVQLRATQPPLLQGIGGQSQKGPDPAQASRYVSEPQLQADARLRRSGQATQLTGRAWLDHEWSDHLMPPQAVGWDWIGMNLDDGAALTAFQLRRADGRALWAGGGFRSAGGEPRNFASTELRFTPGAAWQSPATGARYPLAWKIDTPAGRFAVRALFDAQELDSRAGTGSAYWEGLSELLDTDGRRIGLGYLEMTGYAGALRL